MKKKLWLVVLLALPVMLMGCTKTEINECYPPNLVGVEVTQLSPGVLNWQPMAEASGYKIKLSAGASEFTADVPEEATSYDLSTIEGLTAGTTYNVQMMSKGGKTDVAGKTKTLYSDSPWSTILALDPITYTHKTVTGEAYQAPSATISRVSGLISWSAVSGATGYTVRIIEISGLETYVRGEQRLGNVTHINICDIEDDGKIVDKMFDGEYKVAVAVNAIASETEFERGSAFSDVSGKFLIERNTVTDTVELTATTLEFEGQDGFLYNVWLVVDTLGHILGDFTPVNNRVTIDLTSQDCIDALGSVEVPLSSTAEYAVVISVYTKVTSETHNNEYLFTILTGWNEHIDATIQ